MRRARKRRTGLSWVVREVDVTMLKSVVRQRVASIMITALVLALGSHGVVAQKLDFAGSSGWWGHVPIMAAIEKGFFKEQGIDVELKSIPSSADRIAALTAGSVAFSNLGRISPKKGANRSGQLCTAASRMSSDAPSTT